jgi:hypothetical protein
VKIKRSFPTLQIAGLELTGLGWTAMRRLNGGAYVTAVNDMAYKPFSPHCVHNTPIYLIKFGAIRIVMYPDAAILYTHRYIRRPR